MPLAPVPLLTLVAGSVVDHLASPALQDQSRPALASSEESPNPEPAVRGRSLGRRGAVANRAACGSAGMVGRIPLRAAFRKYNHTHFFSLSLDGRGLRRELSRTAGVRVQCGLARRRPPSPLPSPTMGRGGWRVCVETIRERNSEMEHLGSLRKGLRPARRAV